MNQPDPAERTPSLRMSPLPADAENVAAEAQRQADGEHEPNPQAPAAGKSSISKKAKALAALADHIDWTDQQIADAADCHVKSLYRWPEYARARELLREGRGSMPRGSKDKDTGDVEAWDDDE